MLSLVKHNSCLFPEKNLFKSVFLLHFFSHLFQRELFFYIFWVWTKSSELSTHIQEFSPQVRYLENKMQNSSSLMAMWIKLDLWVVVYDPNHYYIINSENISMYKIQLRLRNTLQTDTDQGACIAITFIIYTLDWTINTGFNLITFQSTLYIVR